MGGDVEATLPGLACKTHRWGLGSSAQLDPLAGEMRDISVS